MPLWRIRRQNVYIAYVQCESSALPGNGHQDEVQILKEMEAGHDRSFRLLQV